ncbi:hypothetical protein DPMN_114098 [Dreissena polymorpha]|uniref:Uncharacterized protein n=1 Tax=Dreissena polymorpha TaxID=45954 RepID=A0A9D4QSH2_DREPO|nr:hypothetical protein DPMN_114098 [Dreissena polymorpha]
MTSWEASVIESLTNSTDSTMEKSNIKVKRKNNTSAEITNEREKLEEVNSYQFSGATLQRLY